MNNKNKYQAIVACIFLCKDDKLLIAKRSADSKFLPSKYELIGGHVDFGETVEDGLEREVKEELDIDIKIGKPFYIFTYVSDNKSKHSVEICYFATMLDPDQRIKLNPKEHSEYRWITKNEVDKYFLPDDPEKLAAKRGFANYGKG